MLKVFFCLCDSRWMLFYHFGIPDRILSSLLLRFCNATVSIKARRGLAVQRDLAREQLLTT